MAKLPDHLYFYCLKVTKKKFCTLIYNFEIKMKPRADYSCRKEKGGSSNVPGTGCEPLLWNINLVTIINMTRTDKEMLRLFVCYIAYIHMNRTPMFRLELLLWDFIEHRVHKYPIRAHVRCWVLRFLSNLIHYVIILDACRRRALLLCKSVDGIMWLYVVFWLPASINGLMRWMETWQVHVEL